MKKLIMTLVAVAISSNLVCSNKPTAQEASIEKFTQLYTKCLEEAYALNKKGHTELQTGWNVKAQDSFKEESQKNIECSEILKYLTKIQELKIN